jgi:hypothetical protein
LWSGWWGGGCDAGFGRAQSLGFAQKARPPLHVRPDLNIVLPELVQSMTICEAPRDSTCAAGQEPMAQCSELASHQSSLVQPLIVLTAPLPRPIAEIHLTDEQQNPTAKQPTRIYHFPRAQRPLRRKLNPTFTKTPHSEHAQDSPSVLYARDRC